jgi:glycosyltransferase involved in cell wall biosynthesis
MIIHSLRWWIMSQIAHAGIANQKSRVCLGMPLFNQTKLLHQALDSLIAQTFRDFRIVILDDSTEPESERIARVYALQNLRISYIKNPARKGMVDNWRACVEAANGTEYFAWVADHDLWNTQWLEKLVAALDRYPEAVLAYPISAHMDSNGNERKKKLVHRISTVGLPLSERVDAISRRARGYGKMVYGLFRLEALHRAGVFRHLLYPDVILLHELAMQGEFIQIDEPLWHRRRTADFSVERQRRALFDHKPWYIYLPWPLVNFASLLWNHALRSEAGSSARRLQGLRIAFLYLGRWSAKYGDGSFIGSYYEWRHGKKPWIKRLKNRLRGA